ncbi:MAG: hypothetical protein EBQ83_05650 [Burkholderiaceae bacterium]|nr:hypothetical protein [Burkholderiaceae bacterium]
MTQVNAGKLKALGVTTQTRSEAAPNIPTIAEQGYPTYEMSLWFGLWAPSTTPAAIIQKINADINLAMQDKEVMNAYAKAGIRSRQMTTDEFKKFVRAEMTKYEKIAQFAGIEAQ